MSYSVTITSTGISVVTVGVQGPPGDAVIPQYVNPIDDIAVVKLPIPGVKPYSRQIINIASDGLVAIIADFAVYVILYPGDSVGFTWDTTSNIWRVTSSNRSRLSLLVRDPYNFTAIPVSSTSILLYWGRPVGAVSSGYSLEYSSDDEHTWKSVGVVIPPDNCFGVSELTPNTNYVFRLNTSVGTQAIVNVSTPAVVIPAGNNGTGVNSPTFVAGLFGQELHLDGSQGVLIPEGPFVFQAGATFTLEAIIKPTGGVGYIASHYDHTQANPAGKDWKMYAYNGENDFGIDVRGIGACNTSGLTLADGNRHYIAAVVNGGTLTLYADGIQVAQNVTGGAFNPLPTADRSIIGFAYDSTTTGDVFYAGDIEEFRLSDIARTIGPMPTAPFTADGNTRLLLHFNGNLVDSSPRPPASHYVDPVSGSDVNDGLTSKSPKQHIPTGLTGFSKGDAVLIKGKTSLNVPITCTVSGAIGNLITIGSYGAGRAIINTGNSADGVKSTVGGVRVISLEINGPGVDSVTGVTTADDVVPSMGATPNTGVGIRFSSLGTTGPRLPDVEVYNCHIHGTIVGVSFETPWALTSAVVGFNKVKCVDSLIHNIQKYGLSCYGAVNITGSTHGTAEFNRNEIYDNTCCPDTAHAGTYGAALICMNVGGGTVIGNLVHDSGQAGGYLDHSLLGGTDGIILQEAFGVLVQGNEVFNIHRGRATSDGGGIDLDGGSNSCLVEHNYCHDCDAQAFAHGEFGGSSTTTGNTFRYNKGIRCGVAGGTASFLSFGGQNLIVHNNLFDAPLGAAISLVLGGSSNYILNNIFIAKNPDTIIYIDPRSSPIVLDGNNYWRNDGAFLGDWHDVLQNTFATFKVASGGEQHGVFADPALQRESDLPRGNTLLSLPLKTSYYGAPNSNSPSLTCGINITVLYGINIGSKDFVGGTPAVAITGPITHVF